ncbi:type I polyketide synthase [Paenibacillus xylanexedens]|uniref:Acyl transferase domain-containing protein/acyl carrier protein n=1 Tax=Paenibacillus xylanexedens TaxID=528191 RepID=A0ABS4RSC1_PAEXY|nr:SDR family NAD(P)-dependent oxidoreductase [Paenibacillus xylanexedens]MBP2245781.1 acyl transferase domain-containing protein/acyl carrier protein [Paenibacillus xylanexedens]
MLDQLFDREQWEEEDDQDTTNELDITTYNRHDIAVIGIGAKLPTGESLDEFWKMLDYGIDCIRELPNHRKGQLDQYLLHKQGSLEHVRYLNGAYLDEIDEFDYSFFRMSAQEAKLMSPVQRLFLQTVWRAVEDAGYGGDRLAGSSTGVYVGVIGDQEGYKYKQMVEELSPDMLPIATVGNLSSIIPARIAYLLNLTGPAMVVDTACSSSLVALDMAVRALREGSCDMAIAGGIRLNMIPLDKEYYKIGIESSDGTTRTFDEDADGSGMGEGVVSVVLKPVEQALRDHDHVYAVIKGTAVNQNGYSAGITTPNAVAHEKVLTHAWRDAGIHPESLSYLEAHGTGTLIGDPIELEGIQSAFRRFTDKKQFCAIGSVKSNVGHLYDSAGLAGLLKAIMALRSKRIPSTLHFNKPNPKFEFDKSPVYVNVISREWEGAATPRRCGVSSFGLSGTNCHVVLEEAPNISVELGRDDHYPFLISSVSSGNLSSQVQSYVKWIKENPKADVRDVCCTAATGRQHHAHRAVWVVNSLDQLLQHLNDFLVEPKTGKYEQDTFRKRNQLFTTEELISNWHIEGCDRATVLEELCTHYQGGAQINWSRIYPDVTYNKLSLPTYSFEESKCWIDTHPDNSVQTEEEAMYYSLSWKPWSEIGKTNSSSIHNVERVLLIRDDTQLHATQLVNQIREAGVAVIEAILGTSYLQQDAQTYVIRNNESDYIKLLQEVSFGGPYRIVHIASLDHVENKENTLDKGLMSVWRLTKACSHIFAEQVEMILVTSFANEVTGDEKVLYPENSAMLAFGHTVQREIQNLECFCIDVDQDWDTSQYLRYILGPLEKKSLAIRNGQAYQAEFAPADVGSLPDVDMNWKEDGVYIITGGLGGLGMEIAERLLSFGRMNLALIARTPLPKRHNWDIILNAKNTSPVLKSKLLRLLDMEKRAGQMMYLGADVADADQLSQAIEQLRSRFGCIRGIIHAAGVGSTQHADQMTEEEFTAMLAPKVKGAHLLDQLTAEDQPDFLVMFSSVATLFGSTGQAAYAAANAYQDAYAPMRNRKGMRTITLNWTTWKEVGMASRAGFDFDTLFKAMPKEWALDRLFEIMGKQTDRLLVGEMNWNSPYLNILNNYHFHLDASIGQRLQKWMRMPERAKQISMKKESASSVQIPTEEYELELESCVEMDRTIANIVGPYLGIKEMNVHDSFFELGADSIMIKQIFLKLDKTYPGKLILTDLFEYPSISRLTTYMSTTEKQKTHQSPQKETFEEERDTDLENLFDEIERGAMDLDEAIINLQKM